MAKLNREKANKAIQAFYGEFDRSEVIRNRFIDSIEAVAKRARRLEGNTYFMTGYLAMRSVMRKDDLRLSETYIDEDTRHRGYVEKLPVEIHGIRVIESVSYNEAIKILVHGTVQDDSEDFVAAYMGSNGVSLSVMPEKT